MSFDSTSKMQSRTKRQVFDSESKHHKLTGGQGKNKTKNIYELIDLNELYIEDSMNTYI